MRLLAFAPLLALAAAKLDLGLGLDLDLDFDLPTSSPFCPSGASTSTLWLADDSAYACAPLPGRGASKAGSTCIKASAAALQGGKDLCKGAGDCAGGQCVELGGGMRRVCWTVASEGECAQFSKSK